MTLSDNRCVKATAIYGYTESPPKLPKCLNLPHHLTKDEKKKKNQVSCSSCSHFIITI